MAATRVLATVRAIIATRTIVSGRFVAGRVSLAEMIEASGCERRPVMRVLDRLTRDGWLGLVEDVQGQPDPGKCGRKPRSPVYLVHRDIRLHRAHQDHSRVTCRDKLWTTLRALRRTTVGNLVRLTGCNEDLCRHYMVILLRNGFVRRAGLDGLEKVWVLIKDPGPRRPETKDHTTGEEA